MADFIDTARAEGHSDEEISNWLTAKREEAKAAGYDDHEVDNYIAGFTMPRNIPQPFLDRFAKEMPYTGYIVKTATDVFNASGGAVVSPKMEADLRGIGLWNDPTRGQVSPLRFATEAVTRPAIASVTGAMSLLNAGIAVPAAIMANVVAGGDKTQRARAFRDFNMLGQVIATLTGAAPYGGPISKPHLGPTGEISDIHVGDLPTHQTVIDSAKALGGEDVSSIAKEKAVTLYETKGVHPAEIVDDASRDVTVKQNMLSINKDLPYGVREEPRFTAEPDHENPNQFVAKNEAGEVVATGDTLEEAIQKATADELATRGTTLTTEEGGGAGGAPPLPPGEQSALPPPPEGPRGPTIEHETMSYDDAKGEVLGKLSVGEPEGKRPWTFSRIYTNLIDRLFPLSRETLRAAGKLGEPLTTANNPEHLARLLSGTAGKAEHMLRYGTFDFHSYQNVGPSLEAILAPIRDKLDDFRAYIASRHALSLEEKGISSGIDVRAAERVVDEKFSEFAGIHGQLVDYQNQVAAYLRDSGVISKEGYTQMVEAHENFVPFYRLFNEDEGFGQQSGTSMADVKRNITSSDSKIIDPLESIIKNTYLYTHMAEHNHVKAKLVELLDRAGEAPITDSPMWANPGDRQMIDKYMRDMGVKEPESLMAFVQTASEVPTGERLTYLRDGVRESRLVDPELALAMKSLNREALDSLIKMLQIPASYLRAGAVLTPEFMARHLLRDYQYAFITAKGVFSPIDMMRGMWGLISKDKDYQNWLKSGGANISVAALDRNYLQESIADLTKQTGLGVRAQNVVDMLNPQMDFSTADLRKQLLHPLQVGLELAQSASHLGAFKKAMRGVEMLPGEEPTKPMILAAGQESRSTGIDPARVGASMNAWNAITAFGNVALQDSDRIVRAFKDRPLSTALKITGAMTLPSVLLWTYNHDDPDWAEIPQWQKDMFWIVPAWKQAGADGKVHTVFFRLPKPWATGLLFASGPERILQNFLTDNPTSFESFVHSLKETTLPNLAPTAVSPIVDHAMNEHVFSGRTLIPKDMEHLLPEYQYTQYTTELAKRLGQNIAPFAGPFASPIILENYLRGWTGGLGQYVLNMTDQALRQNGILPDPPKPTSTLADIPVVRAFAIRYPSATTESIEEFHKSYAENKMYFDTFMAKAQEGDEAAMQKIMDRGGPSMFIQLDGIQQAIATQNKVIRDIWKNPEIKPEEKRQFIDELYYEIIDVARQGNAIIKTLPK